MEYKVEDGFVYKVEEVVTKKQNAIIETFYDNEFNTKLSYDKENKKVKAEIYNYLNELDNYNGDITFEYEGNEITVEAENGVAEIDFYADEGIKCTVRTRIPNFRNGEVTFVV